MIVTVMTIVTCLSYTISIIKRVLEVLRAVIGIKSLNTYWSFTVNFMPEGSGPSQKVKCQRNYALAPTNP